MNHARFTGWSVDRQYRWITAGIAVAALVFSVVPAGFTFDPAARAIKDAVGTAGSFRQMWLPWILVSTGILALRYRWVLRMAGDFNPFLLLLLGWCLASAAWAPSAGTALRQAFAVLGVALGAFAFVAAAWDPGRWRRLMLATLAAMAAASVAVAYLRPDIGVHSENQFELLGAWRGVTYQKNGLGQLSAVSLILFTHADLSGRLNRWLARIGGLLALFLLVKSRSSTSLMLSLMACTLLVLLLRPPVSARGSALVAVLALLLALAVPLYLYVITVGSLDYRTLAQPFAEFFGKDASFSGRTDIWAAMMPEIGRHPWLGIGFNGFWGPPGSPSDGIARRLGWAVPNAHSGYLDLLNELGLIGLALFLAFLFQHGRALSRLAVLDRAQFSLHLALFAYLILANLSESGWFRPISLVHVLATFSSAEVSRQLIEHRLRASRQAGSPAAGHGFVQKVDAL